MTSGFHDATGSGGGLAHAFEQPYEDRGQLPGQLPKHVAQFIDELEMTNDELNAAVNASHESFLDERVERDRIRAHIQEMERHPQLRRDDKVYVVAQKQLQASRERVAALQERHGRVQARWQPLNGLVTSIAKWRVDHAGDMIEPFAGPAPKLARNEKPLDAIGRLRKRVAEIRQEAGRIERAPIPAAEAKAAAKAFIEHMAFAGRPDVAPLLRGENKPDWPHLAYHSQHPVWTDGGHHQVAAAGFNFDAVGLTAWLHGPAMLKALEAQIDAEAKDDRAIPTEGRAERLEALAAEMLAIEREEEAIIRAVAEDGIPVERRPDASPEAVLQVRVAA
ncbi:MAG: hypothetical protein PGN25_05695 [Methylorubrum populi]